MKTDRRRYLIRWCGWICVWSIWIGIGLWTHRTAGENIDFVESIEQSSEVVASQSSEPSHTFDEQRMASMVDLFYALDDAPPLVGLSVAVITPQRTIQRHFGSTGHTTSTGERETPSDTTYYEIASLSKTLSALLLAEAYRRGELQPETTLGELYGANSVPSHPSFPHSTTVTDSNTPSDVIASSDVLATTIATAPSSFPASEVTVESLATHTSGLPRLPENFIPYMERTPENPYADYPETALREAIFTTVPQTSKYEYSNFGYAILTDVLCGVARSSAQATESEFESKGSETSMSMESVWNYSTLLEARVLNPLGMNDSWVQTDLPSDTVLRRYAQPHDAMGNPSHQWSFRAFQGSGAIVSTLADMTRYGEALLGLNREVAATPLADSIRMTQRIHTVVDPELAMGLAWHQRPDGVLLWHDGETGGYHSFIALDRSKNCAVILLTNCANAHVNQLGFQLLESSVVAPTSSATALESDVALESLYAAPHEEAVGENSSTYYPTSDYTIRNIRGWQCYFASNLTAEQALDARVCELLDHQLYKVVYALPEPVVERLQKVKIWIQRKDPYVEGVCYHPSVEWLREHGVNPDKEKSIDIPNAEYFLKEVARQPMMVFHELAHAWHDQFLPNGYDNVDVQNAYQQAIQAGIYEHCLCNDAHVSKAYGTTNPMEYFAELSECYFGENDFFPFVRIELKKHDPIGCSMIEKLWGSSIATSATHESSVSHSRPSE